MDRYAEVKRTCDWSEAQVKETHEALTLKVSRKKTRVDAKQQFGLADCAGRSSKASGALHSLCTHKGPCAPPSVSQTLSTDMSHLILP